MCVNVFGINIQILMFFLSNKVLLKETNKNKKAQHVLYDWCLYGMFPDIHKIVNHHTSCSLYKYCVIL